MKKPIRRMFVILSVMLLVVLACGRARQIAPTEIPPETEEDVMEEAQVEQEVSLAQEGDILFQDDFQDGQPDGWDITAAWYVQQSGDVYTFESSSSGGAWVPQGNAWSNYAFETAVRLDAGSLLLSFHLSPSGRYMVRLDDAGLYLIKEYPAKDYNAVVQTGPVTLGEWHQIDMRAYNGHIQVYVDEVLWVDYTDSSPLSSGTIAVTTQEGSRAAIDDVLVTKTGPLPSGVVEAPPPLEGQGDPDIAEFDDGIELEDASEDEGGEEATQEEEDQGEEQQQDDEQEQEQAPTGEPDLVVIEATFDPDPAIQGEQFLANYVISNQGDAPSGAFTLLWKFHAATGMGVCSWDYDSLDPGETVWGGCPRMTNADPGQSPTTLTVDVEGEVAESNEDNNELAPTLTLITTAQDEHGESDGGEPEDGELPDLVIESIKLTADDTIRCDVRNLGSGDAPSGVRLTLFIDGERIEWQEIDPIIQSGTANSIWFSNLTLDLPVEARCIADRGNSIEESNDANNTLMVTLGE